MKLALDITAFVYFATVLFGTGLLGYLLWKFLFRVRGPTALPPTRDIPGRALPEMEGALKTVAREFLQSTGQRRTRLEHEKKRLENRLEKLKQRTYFDQQDYYQAAKRRETAWNKWRIIHRDVVAFGKHAGAELREQLRVAERNFREADGRVQEEWHAAIARDLINFEELRGQEVLTPHTGETRPGLPGEEPDDPGSPAGAGQGQPASPPPEPSPLDSNPMESAAPPPEPEETPAVPPPEIADPAPMPPEGGGPPGEALLQKDFFGPPPSGGGRSYRDAIFALTAPQETAAAPSPQEQVPAGAEGGKAAGGPPGTRTLRGAQLPGCSFSGVRFVGVHQHRDCVYVGGDFSGIELARQPSPHHFAGCKFSGANFSGARVAYTLFSHCDLSRTRWEGAVLEKVKFDACRMEGVDWGGADLSQTVVANFGPIPPDFAGAGAPPGNFSHQPPPAAGAAAPEGGQPPPAGAVAPVASGEEG